MTKSLVIYIDTDGRSTFKMKNADIDVYNEIINCLEKKKNLKFSDTYIMWQHVVKVWFNAEGEDD